MAFTPDTLSAVVQSIGGTGIRMFTYETDDVIATVTGANYFEKATSRGLRVSDLIFVSPVDVDVEPYTLVIDAVDADGNATASAVGLGALLAFTSRAELIAHTARGVVDGREYRYGGLSFVGSPGATEISDLPGLIPVAPVHPEHFKDNAVPGTTEMSDAVIAALDLGYSVYGIPGRTYKLSNPMRLTFDNQIFDFEDCIIDASAYRQPFISPSYSRKLIEIYGGAVDLTTTVSANITKGDVSITLASVAGVEIGDAIYLESSGQLWYTDSGTNPAVRSFITRIKDISGSTVTLRHPLPFDFDATVSYTVAAEIWTGVRNAEIRIGRAIGPGYVTSLINGRGETLCGSQWAQDAKFSIKNSVGFQAFTCIPVYTVGVVYDFDSTQGWPDGFNPTPIENNNRGFTNFFANTCGDVLVHGNKSTRHRHATDSSFSWRIRIVGVNSIDSFNSAFTCHIGTGDIVWDSVRSNTENCILSRGWQWSVINPQFDVYSLDGAPRIYDTEGTDADLPQDVTIAGGFIRANNRVAALFARYKTVLLKPGIWIGGGDGNTAVNIVGCYENVLIEGGEIRTQGNYCVNGPTTVPTVKDGVLSIRNVLLSGYASAALQTYNGAGPTLGVVKDCTLRPNGATTHVNFGTGVTKAVRGPNYLADGTIYDPDGAGSWTPALQDNVGNAATGTGTGTWVKDINGMVTCVGSLALSSIAALTTNPTRITGLPFPTKTGINASSMIGHTQNLALGGNYSVGIRFVGNQSYGTLYVTDSPASMTGLGITEILSDAVFYFSFSYQS